MVGRRLGSSESLEPSSPDSEGLFGRPSVVTHERDDWLKAANRDRVGDRDG